MAAKDHLSPQFVFKQRQEYTPYEIAAKLDNEKIGHLQWNVDGEIADLYVDSFYRRRGVATGMWNAANEEAEKRNIRKPYHSAKRTDEGDAWAYSVGGYVPPREDDED